MEDQNIHDNEHDEFDDDPQERNFKKLRTKAEAEAKRAAELEAQVKELKLQMAGIAKDSPQWSIAMKADLSEDEMKVLAGAAGAPVEETESPVEDPEVSADEQVATQVRRDVASGGRADDPHVDNVYEVAHNEFFNDVKAGDTQGDALAKYISKVNYYGQSDDPRLQSQVDVRPVTEALHREARIKRGWE